MFIDMFCSPVPVLVTGQLVSYQLDIELTQLLIYLQQRKRYMFSPVHPHSFVCGQDY